MTQTPPQSFLPPDSGSSRAFVGILAFPLLLIAVVFLFAMPTVYMPWPPKSTTDAIILLSICELLGAACFVLLLACIWSLAAPQWVANLLEGGSRLLRFITASFLVSSGVGMAGPAVSSGYIVPCIAAGVSIVVGLAIMRSAVNAASTDAHS